MKQRLVDILNALGNVETKGESTLIVADCRRALAGIINTLPETDEKSELCNAE